ncbi:MAG: PKD domain-containing protein, partial [Rhodobacteraceae bacterium]|nr:PKD domain-containing protein [Paracoccaceae bacterium]
ARVAVGREAVLDLAGREAGALDGLRGWMIDWGDGTTSRGSAGDVPSHAFEDAGVYLVQVTLLTEQGIFSTRLAIQVGATAAFDIIEVRRVADAVELTFSRPLTGIDQGLALPLPGVTLLDSEGRRIEGSVRISDDATRLIFAPEAGDLPPGTYRLFLNSPFDDMADLMACTGQNGALNVPGGSFVIQFVVDEGRMAGQPRGGGHPISVGNAGGLTELVLRLLVPAGLVGKVEPGRDLPEDARLQVEPSDEGLRLSISGETPLPEGDLELALLHLDASDDGRIPQDGAELRISIEQATAPDAADRAGLAADTVMPDLSFGGAAPLAMMALAAIRPGGRQRDWRQGFLRGGDPGGGRRGWANGPNAGYRLHEE